VYYLVLVWLSVPTSAIDWLERPIPEMTYFMFSWTLKGFNMVCQMVSFHQQVT